MKSKLFTFKLLALFCVTVMFFMANAFAQNNQAMPTDSPPAIIIKSTNVNNSGESMVQHAEYSVNEKSFSTNEVEINDADMPLYVTSPKPEYMHGKQALIEHVLKNARYPAEAKKDKAEGIVLVQVVVEKDGSFTNAQVISSVHPLLDAEALRVVNTLKTFIPGRINKEAVRSYYQIPIIFEYKGK
jgi:protein TonB